ncbi:MAG TPA: HNH endonuclease [Verrucomicrobiales bacterium]|nr:HNH endonuclease [Verrucomicrobiales bacterium]
MDSSVELAEEGRSRATAARRVGHGSSVNASDVTRHIKLDVQCELWGRAAGRCQFNGCNLPLYKSPVTQERVNLGEKAHIYSFSPIGPRGRGPLEPTPEQVNGISNLLLVCHGCHRKIDQDEQGARYSAKLLKSWKEAHETRVRIVTGISPNKKSHVVLYGSRIGDERSPLHYDSAAEAIFPDWYPTDASPINLSMQSLHDDSTPEFWITEKLHLQKAFDRQLRPLIEEGSPNQFSIFGFASQPLLVLLGSLLTDKIPSEVYQLRRKPPTWRWQTAASPIAYRIVEPAKCSGDPVLIISLSARIVHERIAAVLPKDSSIWELTIDECHNDFLCSKQHLVEYCEAVRKVMVAITSAHPRASRIAIFPAMPIACAIELGRARQPKADLPWIIFDQNNKHRRFIQTITIGEHA